jgi:hypothetical protein
MTARIVLNNASWELVPLLALEVIPGGFTWEKPSSDASYPALSEINDLSNAIDYWSGTSLVVNDMRRQARLTSSYMHGDLIFNTTAIIKEGRCVVDDAYSWGFSSLLLLTFCCFTIAFALGLVLLQTDVYWHCRHDRDHQSYSIYTDVLFLTKELKAAFGSDIEDYTHSPKLLCKQIEQTKRGIRLEASTLPLSRSEAANPYGSVLPPDERTRTLFRRDHRLDATSYIEMALNRGHSTGLEMVERTSAASSGLGLQPEAVDTDIERSGPGQ